MIPVKLLYTALSTLLTFWFFVSTSIAISIPEEKKIAQKFMQMVQQEQMILNDPIATHMVNRIGRHILFFLPPQPFDYSFNVVDDDVFNAFAAPGANIFVYRGLITSLDSMDELAGIIGHEIAHAASRHVSESIDRSKFVSIGSLAGMLAGAIIGSNSGGDAGSTIITGSMALGQTAMLAFTRDNETEADEKGIMFLKKSCFSPEGLLTGLMKIRESDYRGVENIPDYVKTHPGTGSRIAHTETILEGYVPLKTKAKCPDNFNFDMVKYRLLGRYSDLEPTFEQLTTQLKNDPSNAAIHYGLGLIYERKFRKEQALAHLKKALAIKPFDPMILLEIGRIYQLQGDAERALEVLKGVESHPVLGVMANFHQANAHLDLRHLAKAKQLLNTVISSAPALYPKAYYSLAHIVSLEKDTGLSHYYLGVYYAKSNQHKTAIVHLKKALVHLVDPDEVKKAEKLLDLEQKRLKNKPQRK